MYHHVKKLMYTVNVGDPDPRFGNMLLEQFGGANGELAAAMQYSIQGLNCDDPARKDLLMDIGTEELSHLEVIGTLARMHLKPSKKSRDAAEADPLIAICGGGGVSLNNCQGNPWTADYLKITGELDVDLRSNIAAEARAKIVYERLINFTDDPGTKDALQFLMTREITHMKAFMLALESMGKDPLSIGQIPPTPGVRQPVLQRLDRRGRAGRRQDAGPPRPVEPGRRLEVRRRARLPATARPRPARQAAVRREIDPPAGEAARGRVLRTGPSRAGRVGPLRGAHPPTGLRLCGAAGRLLSGCRRSSGGGAPEPLAPPARQRFRLRHRNIAVRLRVRTYLPQYFGRVVVQ